MLGNAQAIGGNSGSNPGSGTGGNFGGNPGGNPGSGTGGNSGGNPGSGTGGSGATPPGSDGNQANAGGAGGGLSFGSKGPSDLRNGLNTGTNTNGFGARPGEAGSGGSDPGLGGSSSLMGSSSSPAPNSRPAMPPLSSRIGNHDLAITIDCVADGAVLNPSYTLYPINPPANRPQVEQALVQTIQKTVERRQATVRLGEPEYRFTIRLRVQAEGLPTYFWIYPALQVLHIPLSRENAEE